MADYEIEFLDGPCEGKLTFGSPIQEAPHVLDMPLDNDGKSARRPLKVPPAVARYEKRFENGKLCYRYLNTVIGGEQYFDALHLAKFLEPLNLFTSEQLINHLVHRPGFLTAVFQIAWAGGKLPGPGAQFQLAANPNLPREGLVQLLRDALKVLEQG